MATSSFNKTFVVSDNDEVENIREELSNERKYLRRPSKEYYKKRESGRKSLERILFL